MIDLRAGFVFDLGRSGGSSAGPVPDEAGTYFSNFAFSGCQ